MKDHIGEEGQGGTQVRAVPWPRGPAWYRAHRAVPGRSGGLRPGLPALLSGAWGRGVGRQPPAKAFRRADASVHDGVIDAGAHAAEQFAARVAIALDGQDHPPLFGGKRPGQAGSSLKVDRLRTVRHPYVDLPVSGGPGVAVHGYLEAPPAAEIGDAHFAHPIVIQ